MASTLVALQTVTVGAGGSASITFSSIPQTYTDLVVKVSTRSNKSGSTDYMKVEFNGSSSNLISRTLWGSGSSTGSYSSTAIIPVFDGNTATANTFGNMEITIPNYTSSNYKSVSIDTVDENNATGASMGFDAGLWSNSDPITSITLTPRDGTLVLQYSTATLYGVYKSPLDTAVEAPTIGTATAASTGANVAFTPSGTGAPATSYVATSSPGGITATGTTSPILVTGLTSGTAYTFTVKGQNPGGTGAASAASNSVTPYDGYESIATVYPTGSSLTFSSIPSTYTHLQIRHLGRDNRAGSTFTVLYMQFNGDTSTSNYWFHELRADGTTVTAQASGSGADILFIGSNTASSATANVFGTSITDILDYANTNKYKTVRSLYGWDNNGSGRVGLNSGLWNSTSAISSITIFPSGTPTFTAGSVFELYGIR